MGTGRVRRHRGEVSSLGGTDTPRTTDMYMRCSGLSVMEVLEVWGRRLRPQLAHVPPGSAGYLSCGIYSAHTPRCTQQTRWTLSGIAPTEPSHLPVAHQIIYQASKTQAKAFKLSLMRCQREEHSLLMSRRYGLFFLSPSGAHSYWIKPINGDKTRLKCFIAFQRGRDPSPKQNFHIYISVRSLLMGLDRGAKSSLLHKWRFPVCFSCSNGSVILQCRGWGDATKFDQLCYCHLISCFFLHWLIEMFQYWYQHQKYLWYLGKVEEEVISSSLWEQAKKVRIFWNISHWSVLRPCVSGKVPRVKMFFPTLRHI